MENANAPERHARMARMLRRHHVSEAAYLARVPAAEAMEQVDACVNCSHAFLCDQVLACKNAAARAEGSFCPNGATVLALSGGGR